jgi:hypothetical protein
LSQALGIDAQDVEQENQERVTKSLAIATLIIRFLLTLETPIALLALPIFSDAAVPFLSL